MQQKQFKRIRKLTQDLTFQNFFKQYDKSLKCLLKAFLPLPKGQGIKEVKVLDPSPSTVKSADKKSIMDLRLKLDNKQWVNVELQNYNHQSFKERMLYYWSKNYASQINKKDDYNKLKPCYSLIFTTFNLCSESDEFYNVFSLRSEKKPFFYFSKDICMIVVELPKFKKRDINSLLDLKEQWCYILKESQNLGKDELKQLSSLSKQMEVVMSNLQEFSLEEQRRYVEESLEKRAWERFDLKREAKAEGRIEGIQTGRIEGSEQRQQEMILNMLREGADIAFVAKVAGVSTDYIKKLTN